AVLDRGGRNVYFGGLAAVVWQNCRAIPPSRCDAAGRLTKDKNTLAFLDALKVEGAQDWAQSWFKANANHNLYVHPFESRYSLKPFEEIQVRSLVRPLSPAELIAAGVRVNQPNTGA